ncbi:hypothetical protein D1007_50439 [Hordeum vulgare]|nr:hypothetical protein D1007_50439 [Hordeum vulgare]
MNGARKQGARAAAILRRATVNTERGTRESTGKLGHHTRGTGGAIGGWSNPVNVDFSQLDSIDDPEEYFLTLERLEKADMEIKKLRGETPTKKANYDRPIEPPKKRPGMRDEFIHGMTLVAIRVI